MDPKDKLIFPEVAPSEYTNTSRVIHSGPCIVRTVHVAACGANAEADIYDGVNTNGKIKAHLDVRQGHSYSWTPGKGTDFDSGIYVGVSGTEARITVTYIPESRKAFI